jgi:hypothetical protein
MDQRRSNLEEKLTQALDFSSVYDAFAGFFDTLGARLTVRQRPLDVIAAYRNRVRWLAQRTRLVRLERPL